MTNRTASAPCLNPLRSSEINERVVASKNLNLSLFFPFDMSSLATIPPRTGEAWPLSGTDKERLSWLVGNLVVQASSSMHGQITIGGTETLIGQISAWINNYIGCKLVKCYKDGNDNGYRIGTNGLRAILDLAEQTDVPLGNTCFFRSYRRAEAKRNAIKISVDTERKRLQALRASITGKPGCESCGLVTDALDFLRPTGCAEKRPVGTLLVSKSTWPKAEELSKQCQLLCRKCCAKNGNKRSKTSTTADPLPKKPRTTDSPTNSEHPTLDDTASSESF